MPATKQQGRWFGRAPMWKLGLRSRAGRKDSLSFGQKLSRLATRLREKEWQRYGATVFAGKLAGLGVTLLIMAAVGSLFFAKVYAADTVMKAADVVNPVNTAWTLIAAFLVFGMQVGVHYAGGRLLQIA
ncbi:MAG TPA: hypothetical protein VJQ54_10310 [Candidatus Sulfotelmatobacter sp.]|nr:hypothetical protein [Candidatus Sulfotelmatobacter sp.]